MHLLKKTNYFLNARSRLIDQNGSEMALVSNITILKRLRSPLEQPSLSVHYGERKNLEGCQTLLSLIRWCSKITNARCRTCQIMWLGPYKGSLNSA